MVLPSTAATQHSLLACASKHRSVLTPVVCQHAVTLSLTPPIAPGLCCYALAQEGDRVVMVQEYADGGDLFALLHKYGGRLSERIAVQMVLDPFLRVLQVRQGTGVRVRGGSRGRRGGGREGCRVVVWQG